MKTTALSVLLFLAAAAVPFAQTTVFRSDGRLAEGDQVSYELRVEEGSDVTVRVASVDFQPTIQINTEGRSSSSFGSQGGAVASARVGASERLTVTVRGASAGGAGHFLIRVERRDPPEPIAVPATVEGRLEHSDMIDGDRGGYIDWYLLELSGEEGRVALSLRSTDFDAFLIARFPDGRELTNDDAAGSDAALTFQATEGTVEVGVTSFSSETTGSYTFSATEAAEPSRIEVGQSIEGSLSGEGFPMRSYLLSGEAGEALEVTVSSPEFDTVLEVVGPDGRELRNDDAPDGMGTDSRMLYVFPSSGEAEITVSSFDGQTGAFTLSVRRDPRLEEYQELPDGAAIEPGEEVVQLLGPGDSRDEQGSFFQEFTVEAERDAVVELLLRSTDFDAFLEVVAPDGRSYTDDDSGGGTDSRVTFRAPVGGTYQVRATSYFGDGGGLFTLSYNLEGDGGTHATDIPRSGGARERELLVRFQGRLSTEGGEPENVHLFQARQGDGITITVRSREFTPSFELRGPGGHGIASASGLSNETSLSLRIPEDGEYTIVCGSVDDGAEGQYQVAVYGE
ncbi:MAG: PPC domain-containing protein [Spirochaetaceae bacterium]